MYFTPMDLTYPYYKPADFGVSMFTGYICDTTGDGEYIALDSTYLGLIGGGNNNSGECGGPIGSFYYYSDSLHGLSGDTSLLLMGDSDAISNAASIMPDNSDTLYMRFIHQLSFSPADNNIWGVILAYGGGDTTLIATPGAAIICLGDSVTLSAAGAATYTWAPSTALSATTGASVIAAPMVTTTYTITGIRGTHTYTTTVTVTVLPAPSIAVNAPVICSGQSTALLASGGTTYTWSPALTLSASTGDSVIANPTITTTYMVIGKNGNNCADTVQAIVTVIPSPNKPTFRQHGDTLISSSKHDNQWYRNDTLLKNDTSQYLIVTALGQYWVTVLNEVNGCSTTSDSMKITSITGINQLTVNNGQWTVYPNPASGQFTIKLNGNQNGYTAEIYNELGEEVYQSVLTNSLTTINLSSRADGLYFIYFKSEKDIGVAKVLIIK
jgi:F0F1-type ATP synthase assembly protein I